MKFFVRTLFVIFSVSCLSTTAPLAQSVGGVTDAENYILNGNNVASDTYPWMVALVASGSATPLAGQFCGGSLIDRNWVVTAAHCVDGDTTPDDLEIWAGLTNLSTPGLNAEMRTVRAIYIHPEYNGFGFQGDIALLLLDSPIDTITPVAYSRDPGAIIPGDVARVIGWGRTQVFPALSPNILQTTLLDIVDNSTASAAYGVPLVGAQYLSAGRDGFDTCFGDSGGPLFDPAGPTLHGVVSFGLSCPAQASRPSVYANVGHFAPWIGQFLAQPTDSDPDLSVVNKGLVIANGSPASKATGTSFKKRIKAGKKKTQSFALSNATGSIPLTVTDIKVSGKGFTLLSDDPDHIFQGVPETIKVRARAPKSKRSKRLRGTVLITSTDPNDPAYTFSLKAKSKKK